ncbi:Siroheme synthase [Defluviimonas aquaemixtae]|uniref:uroporphyrinogen-III C-methyltransferase n=1 Tax=Albidovulum aquaemixtae TaxID=1542388 RepID=A0A2R8BKA2_9RHOB|nr:uroporphyrinogen-III C-methyltransferase [Defluviimonas aquaemixtae]SPH23831.1 Siroheme synthase [Defluviimonas aquaemixtae]
MKDISAGKVFLIGAGPGDPELLTLRALNVLQGADVVVFDRLVSDEIMALVPDGKRRIDVGKLPGHHPVPQPEINDILIALAQEGLTVARLKGGDPLIFARGSEEAEALREAGIAVSYVPGITAAQGAAAAAGLPLTHRGLATGIHYVTGHRARDARLDLDWAALAGGDSTLVVYMGVANIAEIAFQLMRHGMPVTLPVLAVAAATTPRETRMVSTLGAIAADIAGAAPEAPVLFIIGRVVGLRDLAARTCAAMTGGSETAAYA